MLSAVELELQTAATRAFILADAEEIALVRRTKTSDGAGGFSWSVVGTLVEQTARLVPQSDRVPEIVGSDGRSARPEWVIMMEPGADIARYDQFVWRGNTWEIAQLHAKPDYEIKGDVIRYA